MATTVYTTEEILLSDGKNVTLKPLNIKALRLFMAKFEQFTKAESEEAGLEVLLDAAAVCLKSDRPEFWDDAAEKHTEALEEVLDMQTIYKVLDVCGGVKLNDPNLIAAATEAALAATGTN